MSAYNFKKIIIGGYTKSGTTFIGRAFGIINGVYAKGEQDYFRIWADNINKMAAEYTRNIQIVNREVYDERGSLAPFTNQGVRDLQQKIFFHMFFNGRAVPEDCKAIVEKSPRNIFHLNAVKFVFPGAEIVNVYREPAAVVRSLFRHMADHRSDAFRDPKSKQRTEMLSALPNRWNAYADILEKHQAKLHMVNYNHVAKDTAGFLDYAQEKIIGEKLGLSAGVETLSKDHYLSTLPEDIRAKSLVQESGERLTLSDEELAQIEKTCRIPDITFDF